MERTHEEATEALYAMAGEKRVLQKMRFVGRDLLMGTVGISGCLAYAESPGAQAELPENAATCENA
jgi:hypothetical protein